jgi:dipeptidyl aminopeptidase/acylaminoacyl peptidase
MGITVKRPGFRLLWSVLAAAALAHTQPTAQEPKPRAAAGRIGIDELVDIRHPSNPAWSRDSRWIAFTWERAGVADLYVVPADGSAPPRALTSAGEAGTGVFWSADSRTVYFVRGGTLMRVPADGSTAALPAWAKAPGGRLAPSPDGTRVAYVAADAKPPEVRVRSLVDASDRLATTVDFQVAGLSWSGDGSQLILAQGPGPRVVRHEQTPAYSGSKIVYLVNEFVPAPPSPGFAVPASGGAGRVFDPGPGGLGRGGGNRWVDGSRFVSERAVDFKRREISVVDTRGGEPRIVHQDVKDTFWSMIGAAQGGPQASPDSKWISFLSDRDGWDHLYVVPVAGGEPVQLTRGRFEAWRPAWSPDGTRIVVDTNEGSNPGQRHLAVVELGADPRHAKVRKVTSGRGTNTMAQWSPDGRRLVYQHTDPWSSADLWTLDLTHADPRPVRLTTSMPSTIDSSRLVDPQLVHYPGPDGQQVPAYLFVPQGLDRSRKHPAIVWIHGDGVNQNYDGWHVERNYAVYYSFHQYLLQRGYVVIAPDYRGSIGYGSAWREGVYMDVGGKDFRDAAASGDYLKGLSYVDPDRIGVWGLSYGGFFTLLAVTEMPTDFRAAVNVAGVADYAMYYEDPYHGGWTVSRIGTPEQNPAVYAQASPVSHVDRLVRPLLVLHGTADVNVPYLHSVRLVDELLKKGKGELVEFMTYPGEFHYFTREHVLRDAWTRVAAFFGRHLRPEADAPDKRR